MISPTMSAEVNVEASSDENTAGQSNNDDKTILSFIKDKSRRFICSCEMYILKTKQEIISFAEDLKYECIPRGESGVRKAIKFLFGLIYIPWIPMLYRPGWLVRYVIGPYDKDWLMSLWLDVTAGQTVGFILIPQCLAYALLAGVPAINGLYSAILPSFVYVCLGSSMQLGVGPMSPVSLMTAQIVAKYQTESIYTSAGVTEVLDITAQICVCVGFILTLMSLLNLGCLIELISHPVMSSFTSGSAFSAGLTLLPAAVGLQSGMPFTEVPKTGQPGYTYNYQVMKWYTLNWNQKLETQEAEAQYMNGWSRFNPYSQRLFAGTFIPLFLMQLLKVQLMKRREDIKDTLWFKTFQLINPFSPLLAIVIAAYSSYRWMSDDNSDNTTYLGYMQHNINVVGGIPSGSLFHFSRTPKLIYPFVSVFMDAVPLTFVLFMESYSAARRVAASCDQLHIISVNQEMLAIGIANFFGSISSALPVGGSFSRSSLYASLDTKSLLALVLTTVVVMITIGAVSNALYYIPNAALASILYVALYNTISLADFWESWKHSKKDFFVMLATFIFVFVLDTHLGLILGFFLSISIYLYDMKYSIHKAPQLSASQKDNNGIDVVEIKTELTFVTVERVKNFISALTKEDLNEPIDSAPWQEKLIFKITSILDKSLTKQYQTGCTTLPKAVVLDLSSCPHVDLTGAQRIMEISHELKKKKILFVLTHTNKKVGRRFLDFGFENSSSTSSCNLEPYLLNVTNMGRVALCRDTLVNFQMPDAYNFSDDTATLYISSTRRQTNRIGDDDDNDDDDDDGDDNDIVQTGYAGEKTSRKMVNHISIKRDVRTADEAGNGQNSLDRNSVNTVNVRNPMIKH